MKQNTIMMTLSMDHDFMVFFGVYFWNQPHEGEQMTVGELIMNQLSYTSLHNCTKGAVLCKNLPPAKSKRKVCGLMLYFGVLPVRPGCCSESFTVFCLYVSVTCSKQYRVDNHRT